MIRKVNSSSNKLVENNATVAKRYLDHINKQVNNKLNKQEDFLYLKNDDYRELRDTLASIKFFLTDSGFKLIDVNFDDASGKTIYKYEKTEFGFLITVIVLFDESEWDSTESKIIVRAYADDADEFSESYNRNWADDASDLDLISIRSELEMLDVNAEKLYNAVKNSNDRKDESSISSLVAFLKRINSDLEDTISSWRE